MVGHGVGSSPDSSSALGLNRSNSENTNMIPSDVPVTSVPSGTDPSGYISETPSLKTAEELEVEESYYVALKGMWPVSKSSDAQKQSNSGDTKKRGRNEYYCALHLALDYSPIVIQLVSIPLDSSTSNSTQSKSVVGLIIGGGRRQDNIGDHLSFLEFYLVARLDTVYAKPKPIGSKTEQAFTFTTNNITSPLETLQLERIEFSGEKASSSMESDQNWERIQDSLFLNMMMGDEERKARQPSNPFKFDALVIALHTLTVYDEEIQECYSDEDGCDGVDVIASKRRIPVTYI